MNNYAGVVFQHNLSPCDFVYVNLKEPLLGKSIIPKRINML